MMNKTEKETNQEELDCDCQTDGREKSECRCKSEHREQVARVRQAMPSEETMLRMADVFKLFADSTRIRIMSALAEAELCGCDLSNLLSMSKSLVSHQLRKLREAKLVKFRREGKMVFYSLDDEHVENLLKIMNEHLAEKGVKSVE